MTSFNAKTNNTTMKKCTRFLPVLLPMALIIMAGSLHSQPVLPVAERTLQTAYGDDDDKPKDPKKAFEWRIAWGPKPDTNQLYDAILIDYGE